MQCAKEAGVFEGDVAFTDLSTLCAAEGPPLTEKNRVGGATVVITEARGAVWDVFFNGDDDDSDVLRVVYVVSCKIGVMFPFFLRNLCH